MKLIAWGLVAVGHFDAEGINPPLGLCGHSAPTDRDIQSHSEARGKLPPLSLPSRRTCPHAGAMGCTIPLYFKNYNNYPNYPKGMPQLHKWIQYYTSLANRSFTKFHADAVSVQKATWAWFVRFLCLKNPQLRSDCIIISKVIVLHWRIHAQVQTITWIVLWRHSLYISSICAWKKIKQSIWISLKNERLGRVPTEAVISESWVSAFCCCWRRHRLTNGGQLFMIIHPDRNPISSILPHYNWWLWELSRGICLGVTTYPYAKRYNTEAEALASGFSPLAKDILFIATNINTNAGVGHFQLCWQVMLRSSEIDFSWRAIYHLNI